MEMTESRQANQLRNELPLVTIITPAYNRAPFLDETIQSILTQNYPRIEYIVLDDGSTDHTREVLKRYSGKIHWETHPNMGETRTVNKGFGMAKGDIVCVVNSDDPLLPGAVSAAVALMQAQPDVLAAYPDWKEIGPTSETIQEIKLLDYSIENMLLTLNVAMGPGTFIRRKAFDLVGMRNPRLKYTGDLEFWFRIALHGKLAHIPETLATHRTHPDSASVSERGARMANELVFFVGNVCADPNLPSPLRRCRPKVLSLLHYVAASYCGAERSAAWKHYLLFVWYDPACFFKRIAIVAIYKMLWRIGCKWASWRQQSRRQGLTETRDRFAFVSHVLPPSWSGQAVVIGRLLEGMDPDRYCLISRQNYDPKIYQGKVSSRLPARYYCVPPEFRIGSRFVPGLRTANILLQIFLRARQIARIVRRERSNAVVVGTGDPVDLPAAFLACLWEGASYYPYMFDDYAYQWVEPAEHFVAKVIEPILLKHASRVIVPNEFLRDEYHRRYGVEPVLIRNPCRESELASPTEVPWPLNPGEIKIVYTGAVYHAHYDAFRNLLEAIQKMGRPEIKLHIYTAQPAEHLEREGIYGPVVHHDHMDFSRIGEVQRKADILFLPLAFNSSIREVIRTSAPGKMGEYMASGRPILVHAPSDSFLSWYFRKHRCGLVVDRSDLAALTRGIRRMMDEPALRQDLVEKAFGRAKEDFGPAEARARFMELFRRNVEG